MALMFSWHCVIWFLFLNHLILVRAPIPCPCPATTYTGSSGTIITPNYPNNYCDNANCHYQITVPAGMHVRMTLNNFITQGPGDAMYFYDGSTSSATNLIRKLAGNFGTSYRMAPIYSGANQMRVVFQSDASIGGKGVNATYQAVSNICGQTSLTENQSGFYSPNWEIQGNYPNNVFCSWTIQVNQGHAVQLSFNAKHATEQGADMVNIYNALGTAVPIASYSGNAGWSPIVSPTNYLRVQFTSNSQNVQPGFQAVYKPVPQGMNCSCGQTNLAITNPQGFATLSSPNYPNSNYCSNQRCTWILQVPTQFNIKLAFTHFEMETGFDYVTIFNGASTHSPIIRRCTGIFCNTVISKGNTLTVMMTTDYNSEQSGFQAQWQPVIA